MWPRDESSISYLLAWCSQYLRSLLPWVACSCRGFRGPAAVRRHRVQCVYVGFRPLYTLLVQRQGLTWPFKSRITLTEQHQKTCYEDPYRFHARLVFILSFTPALSISILFTSRVRWHICSKLESVASLTKGGSERTLRYSSPAFSCLQNKQLLRQELQKESTHRLEGSKTPIRILSSQRPFNQRMASSWRNVWKNRMLSPEVLHA